MVPLSKLVLMGTGSPIPQLSLPIGQPSEGQRPLANPVTVKDLALAAAPGLYPKEPGTIPHKLERPSGASVKRSCFQAFALIFAAYNSNRRWDKGQDQKQESKVFLHLREKLPHLK